MTIPNIESSVARGTEPRVGAIGSLRHAIGPWAALLRPRVAAMVYLVALVGGLLVPGAELLRALEAALYITLVTGCASVLNQVVERDTDALMPRTRERPLVTGRLAARDALLFGAALGVVGTLGLALSFGLLGATLSLATLTVYVGVYTPMKRVSTLNTVIGALPGAAPPLLGYAAVAGHTGPWAWALFAILFAWQFPHFMAIAWLYREDYRRGGMRMLTTVEGAEGVAGRQAVLYALALIPVSMLPVFGGLAGLVYAAGALALGVAYALASVLFAHREEAGRARVLLWVSLAYLPLLFAFVLADPMVKTMAGLSSGLPIGR